MKYINFRENIVSGDLLAWTHHGWNSWYNFQIQMVRAFTQSEYSHVGIAWCTGGGGSAGVWWPDYSVYPSTVTDGGASLNNNAAPHLGGGGGGCLWQAYSGSGGSGMVIVSYPV